VYIMVPLFVLLTFVAFLMATRVLSDGRDEATRDVPSGAALEPPPEGPLMENLGPAYLHPGHTWVRLAPDGTAIMGATDFAANFIGALSKVDAPAKGRVLRQGEPAWTLVSAKNRRLTQAMPLEGEVVAVNRGFKQDRGRFATGSSPEWILRVRPARLAENLTNLIGGSLADAWRDLTGLKLNAALTPSIGRTANDGGVWMEDFGDLLDDSDWSALQRDLFPSNGRRAER
jgi:glycine cleavage system H lipoate-binding protein